MKILFIKPKLTEKFSYGKKISTKLNFYPELTLPQLCAITPTNYQTEVNFSTYKKINYEWDGDLIAISCMTPEAIHSYKIADRFRKNKKTVVIGGSHPSALPKEAKEHADSVVIGEAEETWPKLLDDLDKGKIKPFYKNKKPVNLSSIPNAKREKNQGISFMAGVQATRGCPMGCDFCSVTNSIHGRIFRKRPINQVIQEIKKIKHKNLYFYDSSLTIDIKYTKQLFKELKNLNKKFTCFGNIDVLGKDEELLSLASKAGCQSWFVGFESINQENIDYLGKTNKVKDYKKAIEKIHDFGIYVIGAFIFGFDKDTIGVFDATVDMIYNLDVDIPEFTILTPYPGTPLFSRLDAEGRILTKDWSKYTERGNVVFRPKNMSPEELLIGTENAYKNINSFSNVMKRMYKTKNFDFEFLVSNLLQ